MMVIVSRLFIRDGKVVHEETEHNTLIEAVAAYVSTTAVELLFACIIQDGEVVTSTYDTMRIKEGGK